MSKALFAVRRVYFIVVFRTFTRPSSNTQFHRPCLVVRLARLFVCSSENSFYTTTVRYQYFKYNRRVGCLTNIVRSSYKNVRQATCVDKRKDFFDLHIRRTMHKEHEKIQWPSFVSSNRVCPSSLRNGSIYCVDLKYKEKILFPRTRNRCKIIRIVFLCTNAMYTSYCSTELSRCTRSRKNSHFDLI